MSLRGIFTASCFVFLVFSLFMAPKGTGTGREAVEYFGAFYILIAAICFAILAVAHKNEGK